MEIKLSAENTRIAILALLAKNLAAQTASTEIIISMFAVTTKEGDAFIKEFQKRMSEKTDAIFNNIIERMYDVDIDEILGQ